MSDSNGGVVVRMPQNAQLSKQMRHLGAAVYSENADADQLVKEALDAGKLQVEWSYVQFDDDPIPVPTRVPQLVSYGQFQGDPDRVLSHRDRFDAPTWKPCRTGRRPTVFPDRATAEETVAEHLATAEHFNIVPGNLRMAQIVPVEEYEASVRRDPSDRIARRVTEVELEVARRKADAAAADAAAIEAGLIASKPAPSSSDWTGTHEPRVQSRQRADGSVVYRRRSGGKVSPSFDNIEAARRWRAEA